MIANTRVLAVVPARGGSKGIPDKNMRLIGGASLIARAGLTITACSSVDRAVISTDEPRYAAEGRAHGLDAPFLRPAELSMDTTGAVETIAHALKQAEAHYGESFGIVLIVEPTCPLRRPEDVEGAVKMLVDTGADSVVTISRADAKYHPFKLLKIDDDHLGFYDAAGAMVKARQTLTPLYYRNGACYALTRDCLLQRQAIFSASTRGYLIDRPLVNIDEPIELEFAQFLAGKAPL